MPLVTWQCPACGETFERFIRLRDAYEDGPPCPRCGHACTRGGEDPAVPGGRSVSDGPPPGG